MVLAVLAGLVGRGRRALEGEPHEQCILASVEGLDFNGLLSEFSLATILLAVFFGFVGFAAFRYGRKNDEPRPLFIGVALMAYGYFVTNAWVSLAIGTILTLALFFPR